MKIIKLTAENVKKLKAVEITPTGEIVTIAGRNAQGKSSVLDAIWYALAGTTNIPAQPIRHGETKARIKLDLGEIVVERRFTPSGSTLVVESAEGARYSSPQKMLDALIGELSFDPLVFARMAPTKQFDELRRIANFEIDIEKLDIENRAAYAVRTEVNREAKQKRAAAAAIVLPPGLPDTAVSESSYLDQIEAAAEVNGDIERRKGKRASLLDKANRLKADAVALMNEANALRERAAVADKEATRAREEAGELMVRLEEAPPLPAPVDVSDLRRQLDEARGINAAIASRGRRDDLLGEAVRLDNQSKSLTAEMERRENAKRDAIMAAHLPVDGLGFGDGIVTYRGVPLEQASSAEQLKVSLAIAMATNPRLRVIRIQDGSLLDEDSLEAIGVMARDGDYQVWIETVRSDGQVGIVIEDGEVVATPETRDAEVLDFPAGRQ